MKKKMQSGGNVRTNKKTNLPFYSKENNKPAGKPKPNLPFAPKNKK